MNEITTFTLRVLYRKTNEYPSFGKFVALLQDENSVSYPCPREAVSNDDMEGVFLGYVKEVIVPSGKGKVQVVVNMCLKPIKNQELLDKDIITTTLDADDLTVLDVYLGNDHVKQEHNTTLFENMGLFNWLCESDTYSGKYVNFMVNRAVTERYYELSGLPVPQEFFDALENKEQKGTKTEQAQEQTEKTLEEFLDSKITPERAAEYEFQDSNYDILESLLEKHGYLMNNGNSERFAISTDFIFTTSTKGELYLANFAREFLIACAYLGAEITIVAQAPSFASQMINVADIPYHHIVTPHLNVAEYSHICVNKHSFEGFLSIFQKIYECSLMDTPKLFGCTFDEMKVSTDAVYGSNFQYSSVTLSEIVNYMKIEDENEE